ncbi:MAG: alpha-ketoglutarate-dependent dioxygenase AlkB, partial [Bauldia sp.]
MTLHSVPAAAGPAAGFRVFPGFMDFERQRRLVATLRDAASAAPFIVSKMPKTGKPFSVRMT